MAISLASMRSKLASKVFASPPAEVVTFYGLVSNAVADSNYPSDVVASYDTGTSTYGVIYDFKTEGYEDKKPYSNYPEASLALIVANDVTSSQNMKVTVNSEDYIVLGVEDYRYGGGTAAQNVILGKQIDL